MMKAILLYCLFWLAFSGKVSAQEVEVDSVVLFDPPRHSVYAELGGNALLGSLNYERLFILPGGESCLAVRIGVLYMPDGTYNSPTGTVSNFWMVIPVEVVMPINNAYRAGKQQWAAEWALGGTVIREQYLYREPNFKRVELYSEMYFLPTIRVGWRYTPKNKAYFLKASITGIILGNNNDLLFLPILPWPSAGVGYNFGRK